MVSEYDIATLDKVPVIKSLLDGARVDGLALDIGIGTGYTTHAVLGERQTVCVDLHAPNLDYYRRTFSDGGPESALCVVARASALPFKDGVFETILCSEVLEHLEDDGIAVGEIARVLRDDGITIITVPYTGVGFTGFLELMGIKTVHDFPGPEHHVRPGYDEHTLGELLSRKGLEIASYAYYLRFFTKLVVDAVSLAHLIYQRVVHRRRAWSWSEAAGAEGGFAFKLYRLAFPLLIPFRRLDKLITRFRGFGFIAVVRKRNIE